MMGDNLGSRASGANQESLDAGMGDRQDPQPLSVRQRGGGTEQYSHEGVSQAERPRQRQIGCETCSLSFEPHNRRTKCSGCLLWTHEECTERLTIGTRWHLEVCLSCHQKVTRKLRVVSAIELRRGNRWDQDDWFKYLLGYLVIGTGYGESRNKDLSELELFVAKAVMNGLSYKEDPVEASPTEDADAVSIRSEDLEGEPIPIAQPAAPQGEEPPQPVLSSGVKGGETAVCSCEHWL